MSGPERYSPPIVCAPPATLHAPHGASVGVCLWLLHLERQQARARERKRLARGLLTDEIRDQRTGGQWLRSVLAYLQFCTGDSWRHTTDQDSRFSPERLWYLDGIRTINGIGTTTPRPFLVPKQSRDEIEAAAISKSPRAEIVDSILKACPTLTDRKILMHLSRRKLAAMLVSARKRRRIERSA